MGVFSALGLALWAWKSPIPHSSPFRRPSKAAPQESDEYPNFDALIGGSFNQDWDIIYGSEDPDEIVAAVKGENSPLAVQNLIRDIELFLAKYGGTPEELDEALERVFQPEIHFYKLKGRTPREGLEKTLEILSSPGSSA